MADGSRWGDQGDGKSAMLTQGCRQDVEDVRGKNLIYYVRDSQIRGSSYGSLGALCLKGWYIFIGRKTLYIYIN